MKNKQELKVGDKIVEQGQVFRIFKIQKETIFYKPYFCVKGETSFTCSIPAENVDKTKIRNPISLADLKTLTEKLKIKNKTQDCPNADDAKELLKSDDPIETVVVLRTLWEEKERSPENFSRSKKEIFELAMERLVQEFALVSRISLEKARERIDLALQG